MLKKFIPVIMRTNFALNSDIFEKLEDSHFTKIKKKYDFEKVEISNERIVFQEGFPILTCIISKDSLMVAAFSLKEQSAIETTVEFVEQLNNLTGINIQILEGVEAVDFLKFENNEDIFQFYLNCNEFVENEDVYNISLSFSIREKENRIRYSFKNEDEKGFASISTDFSEKFHTIDELTDLINQQAGQLQIKMTSFLNTRIGSFYLSNEVSRSE
ncbi:MAG: hypothetical protein KAX49_13525 [Halanaerobiales bacterium]|nr:hypothetical protein [Halanaerobiales bacterium]